MIAMAIVMTTRINVMMMTTIVMTMTPRTTMTMTAIVMTMTTITTMTGEKYWCSLQTFGNSRWYDNMCLEFAAYNAKNLRLRSKMEGDDSKYDVLIDSVTIQGQV